MEMNGVEGVCGIRWFTNIVGLDTIFKQMRNRFVKHRNVTPLLIEVER